MKATIFFNERNNETGEHEGFALMATVECGDRTWDDALEYVYHRMQNIEGSWSGSKFIGLRGNELNSDYSEDVTVLKPLRTFKDTDIEIGHRSMSIGDRVIFNGEWYECELFGFKQISNAHDDVYIAPAEVA